MIESLPPVWSPAAQLLILGSMPGTESLARQQYYAHPRNRFWPIVGELFGFDHQLPYDDRLRCLSMSGVALWDTLRSCERSGSLDSSIRRDSEMPNDIAGLLLQSPQLRVVALNGRKAEQAFRRFIARDAQLLRPALVVLALPSTSPANAGISAADKIRAWARLLEHIARPAVEEPIMKSKKAETPLPVESPKVEAETAETPKRGIFKQPLSKPEPWQFGGRGARSEHGGGAKPVPDAERRGGKSRKVH